MTHLAGLKEMLIQYYTTDGTVNEAGQFVSMEEAMRYAEFQQKLRPELVEYRVLPWRAPAVPEQRRDVWYKSRVTGEPHRWEINCTVKAAELLISKLRVNGYEAWDTETGVA